MCCWYCGLKGKGSLGGNCSTGSQGVREKVQVWGEIVVLVYVSGTCSDGESGQGDKGEEGVGQGDVINLFVVGVVFMGVEKYKING